MSATRRNAYINHATRCVQRENVFAIDSELAAPLRRRFRGTFSALMPRIEVDMAELRGIKKQHELRTFTEHNAVPIAILPPVSGVAEREQGPRDLRHRRHGQGPSNRAFRSADDPIPD